ncbi:MAG TPA: GAF domain-containing protein, partial [Burkholderiaceae bacterium]
MMRRWRLFPKYALLIIALVAGMGLASGAVGIYFSHRENQDHLVALQREKAHGAADRIEQYVLSIEQQLSWTALPHADSGSQDVFEARRIEYLKLLRQVPAITEAAWIDARGREQLRVSRLAMDVREGGADFSLEPKFLQVSAGKTYYGPVYFRKGTEPYLTVARPAGSGGGVTAGEVNLKFVWEVVSRIRIGEKGLAYVVDAGGTLIAHPDISLVLKKTDLRELPQVAALAAPQDPVPRGARNLQGEPVLSAHARIPTLGWTVFVESPRAEAYAPLYATLQRMGLVLVAALLVAVAASYLLARALVRPLRSLQEGAAHIGAGELDRRIEVRTGDELEGLAEQFNQMGAALKASYASLERKVEARTAELSAALEQQTASAEVLQVISSSIADAGPVFAKIAQSCSRLFATEQVGLFLLRDDGLLHAAHWQGSALEAIASTFPRPLEQTITARVLRERMPLHVPDVAALPDPPPSLAQVLASIGNYSAVWVPMLWDQGGGSICLLRQPPKPFTDKELALLKSFADQAVIAIQNVRLFNETKEALERQTATAEILRVISGSVTDTQPVFDAIVSSCHRLFSDARVSLILPLDHELVSRARAGREAPHAANQMLRWPIDRASAAACCILDSQMISLPNLDLAAETYPRIRELGLAMGFGSGLFVPLLRDAKAIGCLSILRVQKGEFQAKEISLAQTFADQAVIAIENVRLFNETKEALEQQTATAEILQVISRSPTDVQPVFDAIAERALALCEATVGGVTRFDGELVHLVAFHGASPEASAAMLASFPMPVGRGAITARAIAERAPVQIQDVLADPDYTLKDVTRLAGYRSNLAVPMLREGQVIGSIGVCRAEPGVFPDKQVRLLQTFADQAVIAIENVRLFNETKEALERQTATAEILKVISESPTDVQPVFDVIAGRAGRLTGADYGWVFRFDGESIHIVSSFGVSAKGLEATRQAYPMPPSGGSVTARAVREESVINCADVLAEKDAPDEVQAIRRQSGYRSVLAVPMRRDDRIVGVITVAGAAVGQFGDKEIDLLQTFARQAVIAIENARLFNETREALEQQTATAEILEVISNSVSDTQPTFDKIMDSCQRLFGTSEIGIRLVGEDGQLHLGSHRGSALET